MLRTTIIIINIFMVAFVAGLAYAAWRAKNRRKENPPNLTKFYDDDTLEGPRLEKVLATALVLSAIVAVSLPLYWLFIPKEVHAAFEEQFAEQSVERGAERFDTLGCGGCHGAEGGGGDAPIVLTAEDGAPFPGVHLAPPLNTVLLRFSEDEVFQIITYGRPGTPMAGWGIPGNGALNEQSVGDLVSFIRSIQITPEEALQVSQSNFDTARAADPTSSDGEILFNLNCARCHTQGYSQLGSYSLPTAIEEPPELVSGGGAFGPNLHDGATVRQFPNIVDQVEFVSTGSDFQRGYGVRGIGSGRMPGFGQMLTEDQIIAIVEYERALGTDEEDTAGQLPAGDATTTTTTTEAQE